MEHQASLISLLGWLRWKVMWKYTLWLVLDLDVESFPEKNLRAYSSEFASADCRREDSLLVS